MQSFSIGKAVEGMSEPFSPVDLAYVDNYVLRCSLVKGDFHWHVHIDQDELFLCHSGRLQVETREETIDLLPGEGVVVPRGVEHRTRSTDGGVCLVIEQRQTLSKGD